MLAVFRRLSQSLTGLRYNGLPSTLYRFSSAQLQGPIIGIDLGTTNSCVSVMEGTEPRVIANAEGARTTPSIVAFTDKGEVLVGDPAKRQAITNSENTLFATKRYIGRTFSDKEVQKDLKIVPYKIVSKNSDCWFRAQNKEYSPSQVAGFVLSKMKTTAEAYLGMNVKNAVITVPAYFNESQRAATKDAGVIAGLNVARIINEPTAAALSYGLNKINQNKTIAVYDLGGGTFDISILEMSDGVCEVKSTNGDTHLGGEDFDNVIVNFLCDDFKSKFNTDIRQDRMALQRIREAAEKAKTELSFATTSQINLPYLIGANSYQTTLSRSKLEILVGDLIQRTVEPCNIAIKDSGVPVSEISDVLLVGGMTRMPKVQEMVRKIFGRDPAKSVNPDEAVAMGAAVQGGVLTGSVTDLVLVDVTSLSMGVNTVGNRHAVIIPKNTSIPVRKTNIFTTSADNQTQVEIEVFQGERLLSYENNRLGQFVLSGIPSMPRGVPKIEVTFDLDNNGLLNVTAKELSSGVVANATLKENPGGLTKEQLEKMAKDAEEHLEADKKRVEIIDKKQRLDSVIFEIERVLSTDESKLESALVADVKDMISKARPMLEQDYSDISELSVTAGKLEDQLMRMKNQTNTQSTASSDSTTTGTAGSEEPPKN